MEPSRTTSEIVSRLTGGFRCAESGIKIKQSKSKIKDNNKNQKQQKYKNTSSKNRKKYARF